MKIKIQRLQIWNIIFGINVLLCTINFFMTSNPYSAFHSGKAGLFSSYSSSSFRMNPSVLLLISLVIIIGYEIIKYKKITCANIGICFCFLQIIVSCINGGMVNDSKTVIYNIITIIFVSILVSYQHHEKRTCNDGSVEKLFRLIVVLLLTGIVCALIYPNRYGIINLDFSRTTRGEITYWLIIGLQIWGIIISLVMYYRHRKKAYLIVPAVIMFFQLAFANRMALIVITIPIMIYIVYLGNGKEKILMILCGVGVIAFFGNEILNIFFLGGHSDMATIFNGRLPLWSFYISELKKHWLCGGGPNLTASSSYLGGAVSEIGVLKWFGEYGIIVGGFQLICIIIAFIKALNILKLTTKKKEIDYTDLIMSFYYISCFVPFLLESHGRILNLTDFFAWFSMYYLLEKKKEKN